MTILYFLICLLLITLGALTKSFNYAQFLVLPIGLIAVLFQKFIHQEKIKELGFKKCSLKQAGKAFIYPLVIIFIIFLLDFIFHFVERISLAEVKNPFSKGEVGVNLQTLILILAISAFFTFIASMITEELAFRGYLITRLSKLGRMKALLYSSVLFGIWHIPPSILLLSSEVTRTAIYAVNIFLLGILFSYLFLESRSLIPSSIFHGVWNALEYTLFGYGNSQGVILGNSRILFDPEEGLVGTFVLLVFSIVVTWKIKKKHEK